MTLRMHHIGRVVASILDQYAFYTSLGFSISPGFEKPVDDFEQHVRVGVIETGGILIELLEPLDERSPIQSFLQKGGGFHHLCYEVDTLATSIALIESNKNSRQITPITHSVWEGRRVVFFITNSGEIFELLERVVL